MVFFWITFAVLIVTLIWGLVTTLELYDRIGGPTATADLDQLVRESW
jgi:hypothetical protein